MGTVNPTRSPSSHGSYFIDGVMFGVSPPTISRIVAAHMARGAR
jgi:hypothetical protein